MATQDDLRPFPLLGPPDAGDEVVSQGALARAVDHAQEGRVPALAVAAEGQGVARDAARRQELHVLEPDPCAAHAAVHEEKGRCIGLSCWPGCGVQNLEWASCGGHEQALDSLGKCRWWPGWLGPPQPLVAEIEVKHLCLRLVCA